MRKLKNPTILIRMAAFLLLLLFSVTPSAAVRSDSYGDMMSQQQALSGKINSNRSDIADLQASIASLDKKITSAKQQAAAEARAVQTNNFTGSIITEIFSSSSLTDFVQKVVSINMMISSTNQQAIDYQKAKKDKNKALSQLTDAQNQLDSQETALKASIDSYNAKIAKEQDATQPTFIPQGQGKTVASTTSAGRDGSSGASTPAAIAAPDISVSEAQARANIVMRESGGNYQARNGNYYGAYQININSLGGDLSPANQDAAATNYAISRYGSWANAWSFWQSHGWY